MLVILQSGGDLGQSFMPSSSPVSSPGTGTGIGAVESPGSGSSAVTANQHPQSVQPSVAAPGIPVRLLPRLRNHLQHHLPHHLRLPRCSPPRERASRRPRPLRSHRLRRLLLLPRPTFDCARCSRATGPGGALSQTGRAAHGRSSNASRSVNSQIDMQGRVRKLRAAVAIFTLQWRCAAQWFQVASAAARRPGRDAFSFARAPRALAARSLSIYRCDSGNSSRTNPGSGVPRW